MYHLYTYVSSMYLCIIYVSMRCAIIYARCYNVGTMPYHKAEAAVRIILRLPGSRKPFVLYLSEIFIIMKEDA